MSKKTFIVIFFILVSYWSHSQELPDKPFLDDVRSFNQSNLLKINIGLNRTEVIEAMGGILTIQTYQPSVGRYGNTKPGPKDKKINNPYSRDLKLDNNGTQIEILWYYTDLKSQDGAIRKDELTPIIFEANKVIGIGWGFYEDYSKKKELNINLNN